MTLCSSVEGQAQCSKYADVYDNDYEGVVVPERAGTCDNDGAQLTGRGSCIVLKFTDPVVDGGGWDIVVHLEYNEGSWDVRVAVADGSGDFKKFPETSQQFDLDCWKKDLLIDLRGYKAIQYVKVEKTKDPGTRRV